MNFNLCFNYCLIFNKNLICILIVCFFPFRFIRPSNIGDELFIEGKILKVGKNLAFLTVDVKNKITGQIIATGKHTKFVGEQQTSSTSSTVPGLGLPGVQGGGVLS